MRRTLLLCLAHSLAAAGCGGGDDPAERAAAEWVMARGGIVKIVGRDLKVGRPEELPESGFALRVVDLNGRKVRDEDLAKLVALPRLQQLFLHSAGIGDAALEHIARIPSLEELELSYNDVTDDGLQQLAALRNLRKLYVRGTDVTSEGADRLRTQLPECAVYVD